MPRISHGCKLALFATLLVFSADRSGAAGPDWDHVYRPGQALEDGMLVQGNLILHFDPASIPAVTQGKNGEPRTNQLALDRLNERHAVTKFERLFPEIDGLSKRDDPIERQLLFLVNFDSELVSLREAADNYLALPGITRVEPVALHRPTAEVPDDPMLASQTWLRSLSTGGKDIRAIGGWYHQKGDPNILICIADTGVDWQHPDLGGTAPDYTDGVIWNNLAEVNGTPGQDDDGNGKIDDIRGWDFVDVIPGNWPPALQTPPQDASGEDNDPMDYQGHGTSVAGCASALTNNGTGVAGASWGCTILPAKIGYLEDDGNPTGVVGTHWAARAMDYARLSGAHVFNASWTNSNSGGLGTAADLAVAAGMVIVNSAGNDGQTTPDTPDYFGTRSDILSVAALNSSDTKASFSDYGTWVDLSAPGVAILTTGYNRNGSGGTEHTYTSPQGTSFSAPIVAGVAGLYLSANPSATGAEVRAALVAATDDLDAINPSYAGKLGSGRINISKLFDNPMWLIPEQFDDITDAFNAAGPGDSIAIKGSVLFTKKIVLPSQPVSILGGWNDDFTSRDPVGNRTTVAISGVQAAVVAQSSMGPDTIFDGFDISGGSAGLLAIAPANGRFGGGILTLNGASPTFRNLHIHDNEANLVDGYAAGGGIAVIESSPSFEDVEVSANTSLDGAGIFVYAGSPSFTNLNIHDNISYPSGLNTPKGGALYALGGESAKKLDDIDFVGGNMSGHLVDGPGGAIYSDGTNLSITDFTITGNEASSSGGAIYVTGGSYSENGCTVSDNSGTGGTGGGLYAVGATVSITGSDYLRNSANFAGGGIHLDSCNSPTIHQTLLAESSASTLATGLYLTSCTDITVSQSTIANNTGAAAGSNGIYQLGGAATFDNNIFANNGGGGANLADGVACLGGATATFNCNLAWGNDAGNYSGCPDPTGSAGNISADPQFCDLLASDYRIGSGSPGAAAQSGCGDMGSEAIGCGGVPVEDSPSSYQLVLGQNVPNPFNPETTIRFTLPSTARTQIHIFDVRGRLVRHLLNERLDAGTHSRVWNGRNDDGDRVASGIYFYELLSGAHRAVRKMGLVK